MPRAAIRPLADGTRRAAVCRRGAHAGESSTLGTADWRMHDSGLAARAALVPLADLRRARRRADAGRVADAGWPWLGARHARRPSTPSSCSGCSASTSSWRLLAPQWGAVARFLGKRARRTAGLARPPRLLRQRPHPQPADRPVRRRTVLSASPSARWRVARRLRQRAPCSAWPTSSSCGPAAKSGNTSPARCCATSSAGRRRTRRRRPTT